MPQDTDTLTAEETPQEAAKYYRKFFNEMRDADGTVRPAYKELAKLLDGLSIESLVTKQEAADALFRRLGITFAVYSEGGSTERLIPFDLIPRILHHSEWSLVERGCLQRVKAINMFLYDIYHDQEILKAGLVPQELVFKNTAFRPEMCGVDLPKKVYAHVAGVDLVRTGERDFFVLEDNVRTPSGVSYLLENREIMMRLFPDAFNGQAVSPVGNYPERLLENLRAVAPRGADDPVVVLKNTAGQEYLTLRNYQNVGVPTIQGLHGADLFDVYVNPRRDWRVRQRRLHLDGGPGNIGIGLPLDDVLRIVYADYGKTSWTPTSDTDGAIHMKYNLSAVDLVYEGMEKVELQAGLPQATFVP